MQVFCEALFYRYLAKNSFDERLTLLWLIFMLLGIVDGQILNKYSSHLVTLLEFLIKFMPKFTEGNEVSIFISMLYTKVSPASTGQSPVDRAEQASTTGQPPKIGYYYCIPLGAVGISDLSTVLLKMSLQ